jgi:hypothetical protein
MSVIPDPNPGAGKPIWVPVVDVTEDTSTGDDKKVEKFERVFSDRVERVKKISDKSPNEIELEDMQAVDDLLEDIGNSRSFAYYIRDLENRVRVLEGLAPLPMEAFKGKLRSNRRP